MIAGAVADLVHLGLIACAFGAIWICLFAIVRSGRK